jgi:hypothetical protein
MTQECYVDATRQAYEGVALDMAMSAVGLGWAVRGSPAQVQACHESCAGKWQQLLEQVAVLAVLQRWEKQQERPKKEMPAFVTCRAFGSSHRSQKSTFHNWSQACNVQGMGRAKVEQHLQQPSNMW